MGKWTRRAFITTGVLAGGVVVFGVVVRPGARTDRIARLVAENDETLLNVWVKLAPDNSITAIVPHAEMGQNAHTTLAMMLADEMDVAWSDMRVIEAPAHKEYANYAIARGFALGDRNFPAFLVDSIDGFFLKVTQFMALQITGGSMSVRTTGQLAMRTAGAAAKAVLLQAAADEWQVPIGELSASSSHILHAPGDRRAPYAAFASRAATLSQPARPVLKNVRQFTLMGTSMPRLDAPTKIDGSAIFGIDVVLPDMKVATVKASPVFGGTIQSIDATSAQTMPGVRKVIDLGDAVAVVADGYWQAKTALDRVAVNFTSTERVRINQEDIFEQFSVALDNAQSDGGGNTDYRTGETRDAMSAAAGILEAEYRVPYLAHATMEPMNCTAWVHDGQCELWLGTQNPLGFAKEVADALDMRLSQVHVHNQYLGGGFGRRAFPDFALQAARIAADVHYPVKLIWSREEDMQHDHYRQASISRFRAGIDAAGKALAWENIYVDKHDPVEAPWIPYGIAAQDIRYVDSETHVPWGFWRSVDHSLHAFFTESFIDEIAVFAGKDPFAYRHDLLADKPRFQRVLDLAAEKADWGRSLPENMGRGIAIHQSFGTIVAQVMEVEIEEGKARACRVVCAVDAGYAINPDGIAAQMESGVIFGLTAALYGDISIRDGAVSQSNFHDYPMLRMDEAPIVETWIIDSGEPLGGAGEPGTPPIAPALTNAIFDATGVRVRQLPVRKHDLRHKDAKRLDIA
ncbi:MAG: molybdopterin cofactor-binding domain-containing protein [Woeseia sp.]